jgi:hypothetical protein
MCPPGINKHQFALFHIDNEIKQNNGWQANKIAGSDFERVKHGPKGGGQDARNTKSPGAILLVTSM